MNRRPTQSRSGYDSFSPRHTANFKVSSPDTHFFEARQKRSPGQRALLAVLLLLLLVLIGNFTVNHLVFVKRVSVPVTGLSESFEGYTLLHISDLKGASFGPNQELLRYALQGETFNVVLLTGDMISERGNAQPFYTLLEVLQEINTSAPIYFIAGDSDPVPTSMDYANGGSPFAPWVLGAQQRGAVLLSAPQSIQNDDQTIWLTTTSQLNLDIDTMQPQFELNYLKALDSGDDDELDLAKHNLQWLENTRLARAQMTDGDVFITLTHVPPSEEDLTSSADSLIGQIDLLLCGHYLGGLLRLPILGPLFIPSQNLPYYGLLPGANTYSGLNRIEHTWVYASSGLGAYDPLYPSLFFRLFNPPSVTLLSLTPSSL